MDLKIEHGKTFIITGPQGCGKTSLAVNIARIAGRFSVTTTEELREPFGMSRVLRDEPRTVIVEEFDCTIKQGFFMAGILGTANLLYDRQGLPPGLQPTPNFILVAKAGERPELSPDEHRFIELAF